ncbi:hypothetical protein [Snodgrassella alvi]|nr:hypothetical protein [Snodgrassella alvi]
MIIAYLAMQAVAGCAGGEISLFATENKTPLHRLDAMALIRSRR